MARLRRSRAGPTDGAHATFLYTILKQLDLKSIDWQEVADQLEITNGHAARMRFSRFKQQMEGVQSTTRKQKTSVPRQKTAKPNKATNAQERPDKDQPPIESTQLQIKKESGVSVQPIVKAEPGEETEPTIKKELGDEERALWLPSSDSQNSGRDQMTLQPQITGEREVSDGDFKAEKASHLSSEVPVPQKIAVVKSEPIW